MVYGVAPNIPSRSFPATIHRTRKALHSHRSELLTREQHGIYSRLHHLSGLESGFGAGRGRCQMSTHAKVTTIAHTAAGTGQLWYRVTGQVGVSSLQVAYRVGTGTCDGDDQVRRVRFVGRGATAELIGFRPGELVTEPSDFLHIDLAFSGQYLTNGVKTQRSRLARVPAAPVYDVVSRAVAAAGVEPEVLFSSRDGSAWWRALERAAGRDRSVSFLTADGVLRTTVRAGVGVAADDLQGALGGWARALAARPVETGRGRRKDAVDQLDLDGLLADASSDVEIGERLWRAAGAASSTHVPVGNAGYELTLTVPKSISLFALSGDPANQGQWLDAMEAAATRALERLMAEAGFCSTGHRGDGFDVRNMPADGWAGFIAAEISSRAGDPHLHVHCTLPNVLVGRDGIVRTMADGGRELHINAPRFAAWGQEFLIEEATARGVVTDAWFDPQSWQWQLGGFRPDTLLAFSRGRQAVTEKLRSIDDGQAMTARARSRRDRAAKAAPTGAKTHDQPTWGQLAAEVQARARFLNHRPVDRARRVGVGRPAAGRMGRRHLGPARMADAERLRITRLVLERGFVRGDESHDTGMRTGGQVWVSGAALDAEQWLIDKVGRQPVEMMPERLPWATWAGLAAEATSIGWYLTDEQCDAVLAISRGTNPITLIAGVAGSGKTTVLQAARMALEADRRRMLVASTATIAAAKAGHESGAPWMNLTALRKSIEAGHGPNVSVVVIDEASMADVVSVQQIAAWCRGNDKRLVLQGDAAQLGAVAAGDAFTVLCRVHPDHVVQLTTNMRQRTDDGQVIAEALHSGDVAAAWARLGDTGSLIVARNREHKLELLARMVADGIATHGADQVTCDAVTNAEVDDLNDRIHNRLIDTGQVDPSTVRTYRHVTGDMRLGTGTVLRISRPASGTRGRQALVRGERLTVLEAGRDRIRVAGADGPSAH
ncbi:MAG: AAA family ATPase [Actinomycetales bacterium]|nr:AAA family ATPase [Actinomycetales bacterium]